jgi:hypothetical protein
VLPSPWSYNISAIDGDGWYLFANLTNYTSNSIPLGQTLPAGDYKIFTKALNYSFSFSNTINMADSAFKTEVFDDRDANANWTTGAVVTTTVATNAFSFQFFKTEEHSFRLLSFYITSDTNELVLRDDRVMVFHYPSASDNDTNVTAGNRVQDGSFETGTGPFDRINKIGHLENLLDLRSTNFAWHGSYSLKLACPTNNGQYAVHSLPITLASNRVHTVSFYARSSAGQNRATARLISFYDAPSGFTATYSTNVSSLVGTSWTRLSFTTTNLPFYPNGQYYVILEVQQSDGGDVYFDGLQLEEGPSATAWQPKYDFEVGVIPSEITQVYWTNDGGSLTIRAWNNSAQSATKQVAYSVYDWTNVLSFSGSTNMTVSSSNVGTAVITLPMTVKGHFRGEFSITNQNADHEIDWLVVKKPPVLGIDTDSYFGGLEDALPNMLARLQRIGLKWQVTLSSGRLRWEENETNDNAFTWPDFSSFTNYGISILGVLNSATKPSWIPSASVLTNYFGDYVTNAVNHYPFISNWTIWNEPPGTVLPGPGYEYYTEMLRIGARVIKALTPNSTVVGGGGLFSSSAVTNVWALLGASDQPKVTKFAVHFYPGNQGEPGDLGGSVTIKSDVIDALGLDVWNTESGSAPDQGSHTGAKKAFRTAGRYAGFPFLPGYDSYTSLYANSELQSKAFLSCIGFGLTKMFYYDCGQRNISAGDFTSAQWTLFDYDDSLRVKAAMLAGVFSLIDKALGKGPIATIDGTRTIAFAYLRGSTPLVAWWSDDRTNKTITLSNNITASDIKIYDVMGNGSAPASLAIAYGRMPLIAEGQGSLTLANLTNAFAGSTIALRADTMAPSLTINSAPQVSLTNIETTYRWIAIDDQDTPSDLLLRGIEYRYRLDGGSWSEWSGDTWVNYTGLDGQHTLTVQAKDLSGNTNQVPADATPITTQGLNKKSKGGFRR